VDSLDVLKTKEREQFNPDFENEVFCAFIVVGVFDEFVGERIAGLSWRLAQKEIGLGEEIQVLEEDSHVSADGL